MKTKKTIIHIAVNKRILVWVFLIATLTSCNFKKDNLEKIYIAGITKIYEGRSKSTLNHCFVNKSFEVVKIKYVMDPYPDHTLNFDNYQIDTIPVTSINANEKFNKELKSHLEHIVGPVNWIEKNKNQKSDYESQCVGNIRYISPIYFSKAENLYYFQYVEGKSKNYIVAVDMNYRAEIILFEEM